MEREPRYGSTVLSTKGTGGTAWPRDRATSITQTVMFTLANSTKTEQMALVSMYIRMGRRMKAFGEMTCKMGQGKRSSKMAPSTMACSRMERSGVKEHINGLMILFTLAIGLTITSKEKVSIDGPTAEFTMDSGKRISSMAKVFTLGPMAVSMKESIKMIRNMEWARIIGQTAKLTKASGSMVSSTARPDSPIRKAGANWAYGKTVSVSNG